MRVPMRLLVTIACVLTAGGAAAADRELNVRQGPDAVFAQDLSTIVPELAGAKATGTNGRVGNELVFWSYDLTDGRRVFFFACAVLQTVDCAERSAGICEAAQTLLTMAMADGKVSHMSCKAVVDAHVGESRPGCLRTEDISPLSVGLVQCH